MFSFNYISRLTAQIRDTVHNVPIVIQTIFLKFQRVGRLTYDTNAFICFCFRSRGSIMYMYTRREYCGRDIIVV